MAKEYHPIAGSIFTAMWSIFLLLLALTLNLHHLLVIVATILLALWIVRSDSTYDPYFLNWKTFDRKKTKEEEVEEEYRKRHCLAK